jgi:hypothetical protein
VKRLMAILLLGEPALVADIQLANVYHTFVAPDVRSSNRHSRHAARYAASCS